MYQQLERNVRRTWFLISGFVLVVLAIGWLFGKIFGAGPVGLIIAAIVSTGMTYFSYRNGDRVVPVSYTHLTLPTILLV